MDFNALKQKFSDFTKTATEKAKEMGEKTLEFAGENLAKTPLFIRDPEEYKKALDTKRTIILAFDEKHEIEKEIMMMLPIWQTNAFIDTTTFRYMNKEQSDVLILEEKYTLPVEMRVFFQRIETHRFNDLEAIKSWWKADKRDYTGEKKTEDFSVKTEEKPENEKISEKTEISSENVSETSDPLATK